MRKNHQSLLCKKFQFHVFLFNLIGSTGLIKAVQPNFCKNRSIHSGSKININSIIVEPLYSSVPDPTGSTGRPVFKTLGSTQGIRKESVSFLM